MTHVWLQEFQTQIWFQYLMQTIFVGRNPKMHLALMCIWKISFCDILKFSELQNLKCSLETDETSFSCFIGFKELKKACFPSASLCSNRPEYLFWDMYHPTQAASKLAAWTLYDGPQNLVAPINFKTLASLDSWWILIWSYDRIKLNMDCKTITRHFASKLLLSTISLLLAPCKDWKCKKKIPRWVSISPKHLSITCMAYVPVMRSKKIL